MLYGIKDYKIIDPLNVVGLVKALNEQPVSIGINAGLPSFMFYSRGIYDPIPEDCDPAGLNHGVLLVGYNSEHELPYFILKNSWGTS